MTVKTFKYIPPKTNEYRFCIFSPETGEILDDAQGYGYRTAQGAYKAYFYKNRDKSKDAEKEAENNRIIKWMREHKYFVRAMGNVAVKIQMGKYAPDDRFDAELVQELLDEYDLHPVFSASALLRVWRGKR